MVYEMFSRAGIFEILASDSSGDIRSNNRPIKRRGYDAHYIPFVSWKGRGPRLYGLPAELEQRLQLR